MITRTYLTPGPGFLITGTGSYYTSYVTFGPDPVKYLSDRHVVAQVDKETTYLERTVAENNKYLNCYYKLNSLLIIRQGSPVPVSRAIC